MSEYGGGELVRGGREREPLPLGLSLEQAALVYPAAVVGLDCLLQWARRYFGLISGHLLPGEGK